MNSIINGSRFVAVALCGFIAAGCDSIKDVREEPATAPPSHTGVLEGRITGLAPVRGVVLDAGITAVENYTSTRVFFGALGPAGTPIDVSFSYPAVPLGTPYNFTVQENPFGKLCSIQNGSGAVGGGGPLPLVTCVDDPATDRYFIGGTVAPEVASLPEFTVILTSNRDHGVERIRLNGATSFQFANQGINPTLSPAYSVAVQQLFQWTITATYVQDGREYQCRVVTSPTNNTPSNTGYSSAQAGVPAAPAGSAALAGTTSSAIPGPQTGINRHIRDCAFPIEVNAKYSAPPGGADHPMGAGGVTLALRQIADAVPPAEAQPVTLTEFTPGTGRVTLWTLPSFEGAAYDLVVTEHPEGQTCIVRVLNNQASMGNLIWLSNPLVTSQFTPNDANVANGVSIRCRNNPTPEKQLSGVFRNINEIQYPETDTPARPNPTRIRDRQILSFFDDGTFLFGSHGNAGARNGLEYGFYDYDPAQRTLDFNIFLDASTLAGTYAQYPDPTALGTAVVTVASLSNTLGYGTIPAMSPQRLGANAASAPNGGVARATDVIVNPGSPASISMTFTGTPINTTLTGTGAGNPVADAVETSATLTFTEPDQKPGTMTGAWISEDHRRFWVFDFNNYSGFHAGVNGSINVQDGCVVFGDPEASSSYYVRRGGSTGCMTANGTATGGRGNRFFEYYENGFAGIIFSAPGGAPPGFFGMFPGMVSAADGRPPTPNMFTILPGTPETLSVQRMLNGEPLGGPAEFKRAEVKLD